MERVLTKYKNERNKLFEKLLLKFQIGIEKNINCGIIKKHKGVIMEKYITIKDIQHFLLENGYVWKGELIEEKSATKQYYIYDYKYKKASVEDFVDNYQDGVLLDVMSLENKAPYEFYVRANSVSFAMRTLNWSRSDENCLKVDLTSEWVKYLLKYYKTEYSSYLKKYVEEMKQNKNTTLPEAMTKQKDIRDLEKLIDKEDELSL